MTFELIYGFLNILKCAQKGFNITKVLGRHKTFLPFNGQSNKQLFDSREREKHY